jgi:arginyl-tRNA synthetase
MPFLELKRKLSVDLAAFFNRPDELSAELLEQEMGTPPQAQLGHVALPCFKLSKVLKQPSDAIAKNIAQHFAGSSRISVNPTGPYANFRWNVNELYGSTLSKIFKQKERYGSDIAGNTSRVVIEYCSPNIAKKLGFQHIRSTLLGNTLSNIYDFLGYQTERMNFVGDWGSQFARLLAAVDRWGDPILLDGNNIEAAMDHLFEVYVRFHKEAEQDPKLMDSAVDRLKLLEAGDAKETALWKKIRAISIQAMDKTLDKMNVKFNHLEGESHYIPQIATTLDLIKEKTKARVSEGAWIVEVEGIPTPAMIQKKDGTTLYLTRDIAAAIDRFNRFAPDKMFYVVSQQQKLHFQLLFGVLKLMGFDWADKCEHLSFGTVLFGSEKMSTREGRVIFLDELLREATQKALAEITAKNPELANKDEVAETVGVGAIIFGNLSSYRKNDIEFRWESVIALDGETGPYVQYAAVRCHSLLEKAKEKGIMPDEAFGVEGYPFAPEEEALILELARLRSTLHLAVRDNEPCYLTRYLIEVAKAFNRFYYKLPVLQCVDPMQRQLRLNLVAGTRLVLVSGLNLLGIRTPKEM